MCKCGAEPTAPLNFPPLFYSLWNTADKKDDKVNRPRTGPYVGILFGTLSTMRHYTCSAFFWLILEKLIFLKPVTVMGAIF